MYLCYLSILYLVVCTSEKEMAPRSSTLAWKIPRAEEPGRLQSLGSLRVRHDRTSSLSLFTLMHWRRKWQPTPSVLAWRIPGTGEPGGLPSMGSHRVGHDWSDWAAAAAAVCTSYSTTPSCPSLMPVPAGNHWFVLYTCESVPVLFYSSDSFIFWFYI